jgi:hypothetical protein
MTESAEPIFLSAASSDEDLPHTPMALLDALAAIDHRLMELEAELRPLREQIGAIDKEKSRLNTRKAKLKALREDMGKGVYVSDHAVVRYLERRHGFDFESVRQEIMTPALREAAAVGAVGLRVAGGVFKLKGRTVTTYFANEDKA